MNFLQLVRRTMSECGASGGALPTVIGQTGEAARFVGWVVSAWDAIQLAHPNWNWMRDDFSFTTATGVATYTPALSGIATRFGSWDGHSIQCDGSDMSWFDYPTFRTASRLSTTQSRPFIAATKSIDLSLSPTPSGAFTISGEYFKSPQTLALDADVPEMPDRFHLAIVYQAMKYYARYEAAGEVMVAAEKDYKSILRKLEIDQLPSIEFASALA